MTMPWSLYSPICQSKAKCLRPQVVIELDGQNERLNRPCYTTLDRITGKLLLTVARETQVDQIDITLEGSTSTSVGRATTYVPGRRQASHQFLLLRQPLGCSEYGEIKTLLPGIAYRIPFKFVIPEKLLPQSCSHTATGNDVRHAHTRLPPSLESSPTTFWNLEEDGISSKVCKVSYVVRARISTSTHTGAPQVLRDISRPIRVVPIRLTDYPRRELSVDSQLKDKFPSRYMVQSQGPMELMVEQPSPIHVSSAGSHPGKAVPLHIDLRVRSASGKLLPRLRYMHCNLEVATYYGTTPWKVHPPAEDLAYDETDREAHVTTIPLSSLDLSSIKWAQLPSFESVVEGNTKRDDLRTNSVSTTDSSNSSESSYAASVTVPVILPEGKTFVPTFHSCLVSRVYRIQVSLSYHMPSRFCGSTISLKLPVEVSCSG
ncbi:uncharacterized protein N7459_009051 [Penicillium hispanicum]|uniref:uncharacterized protein n=1 Tax=Penicillium hispanicum TaxID=1080232 RepID=UPI00253FC2EB|nr:uncharacterized protein N7459_009051 [Penicillium hispanicum]KAJ5569621.1 hypothetical protein N7459_009051 [Penicillium hispanicum]